jgi:hypothetical protein
MAFQLYTEKTLAFYFVSSIHFLLVNYFGVGTPSQIQTAAIIFRIKPAEPGLIKVLKIKFRSPKTLTV